MPGTEVIQKTQARTLVLELHLDSNKKFARCFTPAGFFKRIKRRENSQTLSVAHRIAVSLLQAKCVPGAKTYLPRLVRYSSAACSSEDSSSPSIR